MIDSEIVVGTGLRITVSRDELAAKLGRRRARRLDPHRGARPRRHPAARGGRASSTSPRPTWRSRCAPRVDAQVAGRGHGRRARPAAARHRALAARRRGHDRAQARRRPSSSSPPARRPTGSTRTRPRTSRACPTSTTARCTRSSARRSSRRSRRVSRSASRDESRPVLTGILVRFEPGKLVMAATDSYRLAVKETPVSGTLPGARGDHPGTRAAGARAHRGRRRRGAARRAGEPRRLRRRRHVADDAPHRRPVPELPPAAAGAVRARAAAAARGGARGRPPRVADGAAQLAAAPALRRRRADGLARSRRTSARPRESLPAPYTADPLEIGFNAEFLRDGLDSVDSDTIKFKLISPLRPAVLEGESDDYVYLIMPIRLAG